MRKVLVGLDLGTSSCKDGVVSIAGEGLAHSRVPTPWRPVPSGAELAAADLLSGLALRTTGQSSTPAERRRLSS